MSTERNTLVRYRLTRAREALDEAEIMARAGHWNTCVNRLYYACFYAASALLLQHSMSSAKHSGIRGLFNRHYAKTGAVPRDLAALYSQLFANRQQADYQDLASFAESDVTPWLAGARRFVDHVEAMIGPMADKETPIR
jgi:uncharacterized protein (UPF0332 family)